MVLWVRKEENPRKGTGDLKTRYDSDCSCQTMRIGGSQYKNKIVLGARQTGGGVGRICKLCR